MQHNRGGDPAVPTGVSTTAIGVAEARAEESARPDRLFEDPLAKAFVTAAGSPFEEIETHISDLDSIRTWFFDYVALRTRFFDDYLLESCRAGCRQVVVLAAGLDTRAFRLPWPKGVRLFELDFPEVFAFKERVLASQRVKPACQRVIVEADLRGEWTAPLLQAGFRPGEPSAWLAEGILIYLTEEENDQLLSRIGQLSTLDSQLAFEHMRREAQELMPFRLAADALAELGVSWRSSLENPNRWLSNHRWRGQVFDSANLGELYGRPVSSYGELAKGETDIGWLVRAVRESS